VKQVGFKPEVKVLDDASGELTEIDDVAGA